MSQVLENDEISVEENPDDFQLLNDIDEINRDFHTGLAARDKF